MLRRVNIVVHLVAFAMVVTLGGYGVVDLMLLGVCLVATWAVGHLALTLAKSRRGNGLGVLCVGLVILFWVAYTSKLALAMLIAGEYWVVPKFFDEKALIGILPEAYFLATISYLVMLTAVLTIPLRHRIDWQISSSASRYWTMLSLLCMGLVVKYILKARYSLAVPGIEPVQLGIPYLTGILSLTTEFGFLFFANIPFFLALASGRHRRAVFVAFLAALANAAIDLRFGSKDTLMFQIVVTISYLLIINRGLSLGRARFRANARAILIVLAVLGPAVLAAYKYMNFLRYAFLSGATGILDAVHAAAQSDIAQSRSSIVELYNRITGIEALAAVMKLLENSSISSGLRGMIDGSIMHRFTDIVMSGADSKVAFSMTLTGYWYAAGGIPAILFGFLFAGFLCGFIQYFVIKVAPVSHDVKLAFLPVLWIMFVQLMLGGNPMIWLKTMIVTLAVFIAIGCIATRRDRRDPSANTDMRLPPAPKPPGGAVKRDTP